MTQRAIDSANVVHRTNRRIIPASGAARRPPPPGHPAAPASSRSWSSSRTAHTAGYPRPATPRGAVAGFVYRRTCRACGSQAESGTTREGRMAKPKPDPDDIPSTVARSDELAQRIWKETHDSAVDSYGEGERAHRTAFASLKHAYEKVGDHWEPKDEKGPSDQQAARGGARARRGGETAGGVDANASKEHLYDLAKRLGIAGRSRMTKRELVDAIGKANDRETARARER